MTSARVMTDPSSGASKGYAFVRFSTLDDARRAVAEMNGALVLGRALRVSEATPRGTGRVAPPQRATRMVGGGPPQYHQAQQPPPGYYGAMGMGAGGPPGPYPMPASGAGGYGGLYGGGGGFGGPPAGPGPAVYYGVLAWCVASHMLTVPTSARSSQGPTPAAAALRIPCITVHRPWPWERCRATLRWRRRQPQMRAKRPSSWAAWTRPSPTPTSGPSLRSLAPCPPSRSCATRAAASYRFVGRWVCQKRPSA